MIGTPLYFSPEICSNQKYNDRSDMWGAGCLFFEMFTGEPPFKAPNNNQ